MRNRDIDFIKGVAIVLMVMGHALTDWAQGGSVLGFIDAFHMPVFFMASGYFFKGEKVATWQGLGSVIKSRIVRLWWPYVVWVTIFLLLNNWFVKCNIYTDNAAIKDFVPRMTSPHAMITIKEAVNAMLFTLPMVYRPEPTVAMWFLKSLLVISVGYAFVEAVARKFTTRTLVVQTVVAIGMLILFRYHPNGHFETLRFYVGGNGVFYGWFLFHVGRIIRESSNETMPISLNYTVILLVLALTTLLAIRHLVGSWRGGFTGPEWLYLPSFGLCSLSGWVLLRSLSKLTMAWWGHTIVEYIGQHTMPILILHFLSFKLVNYIGVLINSDPLFVIAGFPTSYHGWIWTIVYTIVGIVLPLIIAHSYVCTRDWTKGVLCNLH